MDVNNLTPIEAINLLNQIKKEINGWRQTTGSVTQDLLFNIDDLLMKKQEKETNFSI